MPIDQTADNLRALCDSIDHWHWILHDRGGDDPEILKKIRDLEQRRTAIIRSRLARHRVHRVEVQTIKVPEPTLPVPCAKPGCTRAMNCPCPAALACALAASKGQIQPAAKLIGITSRTVYRRLRKWGFRKSPTRKGWTL